MSNSKTKQIKAGSVLSYLQMGLSIIISLLYTPFMLRTLGQSEYGLYSTVSSTIAMLSILSLGFNSGYIRYFAKYKKVNDYEKIYRLNGLFLTIFLVIGTVALVCGLFLSEHLDIVFKDGLTQEEYPTAKVLMILLTVNLAISFPASVYTSIISATENFIFLKFISLIWTVMSPLVHIPVLLLGFRSVGLVITTVAFSVIADLIYMWFVHYKLKYKFYFSRWEKGIFKELSIFTSFIALNMIIDQINWNIDKFLLARFKGTVSVAVYSVGYRLYHYYQLFSTSISGVFTPRIHHIYNQYVNESDERNKKLSSLFTRVGRIQFILLALVASGFVLFGKAFIQYWAGDGYDESYYVVLLLMLPATVPLIQNIGIEIQRAENKHQFRSLVYFIMALINFVLSIYLSQKYGAIGAAFGTALSLIIANGVIMNIYYQKKCGLDILSFWKEILRLFVGLIPAVVFGIIINCVFDLSHSPFLFFASIVVYSMIYAIVMWLFCMNDSEKDLVRIPARKLLRKIKKIRERKA